MSLVGRCLLAEESQSRQLFATIWRTVLPLIKSGKRYWIEVREETRSLEQNARLWAMLADVSKQVEWYGKRLSTEDWKHVFTASLRKMNVVPNIEGTGFVALGLSTRRMTKSEFSELIELIFAFGAERDVKWSDPTDSSLIREALA